VEDAIMGTIDPDEMPGAGARQGRTPEGEAAAATRRDAPGLAVWERIAGLEGGSRDPFEDPYGPSPHCFSSNDVVRMFSIGAQAADVDHLSQCAPCRQRVNRYASVTSQELLVPARAAGRWLPRIGARLSRKEPRRITAPALVYMPEAIGVAAGSGHVGRVRVQLIADPDANLQGRNFHLEGAVTATAGRVLVGDNDAFPWVEFDNAVLSPDTVDALKRHHRITDRVSVRAEAPEHDVVIGTTDVELHRS
jgi:hypothetical protein